MDHAHIDGATLAIPEPASGWRKAIVGLNKALKPVVAIPAAAACAAGIILMHAKYWRAWDVETWGLYGVLVVVGTLVIGNQINVRRVAKLAE